MKINPGAIPYTGNKQSLLPDLLALFPDSVGTFYDSFCGGLSVSLNVPFPVVATDVEKPLVDMYNMLRGQPDISFVHEVIKEFNLTPKHADRYINLRNVYRETGDPKYLYTLLMYAFCNMYRTNKAGLFNTPFGMYRKKDSDDPWIERHKSLTNKSDISIICGRYDSVKPVAGDFVYCDPPYLITGAQYNSKWKAQDDRDLYSWLDGLHRKGVKFGVSNVVRHGNQINDFLVEWSTKYHTKVLNKKYRMNQIQSSEDLKTVEVYICNYPINTDPIPERPGLNLEIFM